MQRDGYGKGRKKREVIETGVAPVENICITLTGPCLLRLKYTSADGIVTLKAVRELNGS